MISLLDKKIITQEKEYNITLRKIKLLASSLHVPQVSSSFFKQELKAVIRKRPLTEPTGWGGVVLKKLDTEKDFVQKLLVIKKKGVLGFEIHKRKKEHLKILEGF